MVILEITALDHADRSTGNHLKTDNTNVHFCDIKKEEYHFKKFCK
jgi:hypothetical protein